MSIIGEPKQLFTKGVIRHDATNDLSATGEVGQNSVNLQAEGTIRYLETQLFAKGIITHFEQLFAKGISRQASSNTLFAKGIIRHTATKDLFADGGIAHFEQLFAKGIIRHASSNTLFGKGIIRHSTDIILRAEGRITAEGWAMQGLTAGVYRDLGVIS